MSFRSQINFLVILLFQSFAINDVLARQPGSIDATFGHGGIVARSIGSPSISKAVAIQSDGKIVQSGWFATRFGLIRYNPNGELDPSFGNNGVVSTNINNWAFINSMMIQDDGGIVAAGFSYDGKQIAAIARYKSNGALDTSFGGGTITTASPLVAPSPSVFNLYVDDMAVQPDGKVIIVGQSYYCAVGDDFCDFGAVEDYLTAVRYNRDGSIDTSFGLEGFLVETELNFYAARIAVRNDGKIIITGGTSILQYSPDGSRDATFGDGGIASAPNTASDVVIQPDGKILISFYAYADNRQAFGIARFERDGTLDRTFGNDGEVVTAGGGVFGSVSNSLALQADGRIVVAGTGFDQNVDWRYVIRRYDPDGTLDNSYGTDGITRVQVGGQHNEGFAVAVDAAGRAVVAGCAFNDSGWGLIRLNGGDIFSPRRSPFDFDGDGKTDISIFRPSAGEWWYSRSSDNAVKAVQFGTSTDIITPGDFTGDGNADVAFFRPVDGFWYILRSEDGSFFSFPFGSNGDIPMPADFDGDGKTDAAVFRPSTGTWFVLQSSGAGTAIAPFGSTTDQPVAFDYDGDGKADIGIVRDNATSGNKEWWIQRSNLGILILNFGVPSDKTVPGDYTGDGKADVAFFRPSSGFWYILRSEDFSFFSFEWGQAGDIPAPGDYDGDGKADAAIFRPDSSTWFVNRTGGQGPLITGFGAATDTPVPSSLVR